MKRRMIKERGGGKRGKGWRSVWHIERYLEMLKKLFIKKLDWDISNERGKGEKRRQYTEITQISFTIYMSNNLSIYIILAPYRSIYMWK